MSTFKKLFASIAAVMIVVSTAPVAVFGQTQVSAEYQNAYAFAYENEITTMGTVATARLFDYTTRAEFSKMVTNYAVNVLDMTPNTASTSCTFGDLASVAGTDLAAFAVTSCQLGLMGINTNGIFNPNGTLSRAEAFTVVSRLLWGDTYNGGNPFYSAHFNAMNQAGLLNDLTNAERPVIRGDIMIVLKRASEADLDNMMPGFCADIETVFACTIDPDGSMGLCPAACIAGNNTDPDDQWEVKAGSLNVSLNSASTLANNSQIPSVGTVKFASVDFSASSSDVALKTVEIEKMGLATISNTTRVWFERNGVRITGRSAFTSEGKAILSFAPAFVVKANSTETLDLYVIVDTTPGFDFQFRSAAMDTSALSINGSFMTPVLRTVDYTVSAGDFSNVSAGNPTANVTAAGMEVGAFSVMVTHTGAQTRDAMFKSITLRHNGVGSLSSLGNIVLERNGIVVSSSYVINGRDITFTVNDTILDNTTATYYIRAVINNVEQSPDTHQFQLRSNEDLNIAEKTTSFRVTITGATSLDIYSIEGGDITFARDTALPLSASYAPGSQDVILMKGTMKSNSAITVEDPTVAYMLGLDNDDMFDFFSTIYLSVGGSTFSYSPQNGSTGTVAEFLGTATINGTVQVKMWGTLKQTASQGQIKMAALQLSSFANPEYVSNGNTVGSAIGSIEGINVTVEGTQLNVTRTDGQGNQTIAAGLQGFSVMKLNLTAPEGNGVRLSRAIFGTGVSSGAYHNNVSLTLYVDGNAVSTKNLSGGSITFDFPSTTITTSSPKTLEVKANFAEAYSGGVFQLALAVSGLNSTDVLTSVAVAHQAVSSAEFTIGAADVLVSASNDPVLSQLLLSPSSNVQFFAFRVKAINDTVQLRDLTFTGTNLSNLTNFRLAKADGTVFASASSLSDTAVTFSNISANAAPTIAKDATDTYFLVANVNNNISTNPTFAATLTTVAVRASNGSTVTETGLSVASNTHTIAETGLMVAKAANGSKNLSTSAMRFTVTASGKDSATVTGMVLNTSVAGYTGTATVSVYKTSVSAPNLVGTGTIGAVTIVPTANNVVDAGTTATYIVVVTGLLVDPDSSSQDWSVTLSNLFFNGLSAITYDNVGGNLPITEQK